MHTLPIYSKKHQPLNLRITVTFLESLLCVHKRGQSSNSQHEYSWDRKRMVIHVGLRVVECLVLWVVDSGGTWIEYG